MTRSNNIWRKILRWRPFDTLVARLVVLLVLGLAGIELANSVLWSELRTFHRGLGIQEAAMRMVVYTRILERLPREEQQAYVDIIRSVYSNGDAGVDVFFRYTDTRPDMTPVDSKPIRLYSQALAQSFARAGIEREFLIKTLGGNKDPDPRYPVPYMLTAIRLEDGTWMTVGHKRDHGARETLVYRYLTLLVVIALAALVTALVLHSTKPLRKLAACADAFGRNPEIFQPLPETGTREVREVAQSFNLMRERICASFEERNRLMTAIAHDLRTPLTRARLRLEHLHPRAESEKLGMDLDDLELFVARGLDFAKSHTSAEKQVPLDIRAFLQSIVDDVALDGTHVPLEADPVAGPLLVKARPSCLKRCVNNLLNNALTYADSARVRILVVEDMVRIEISDNGPGIPDDKIERVFMPYYRLDNSRNTHLGGTGLGLSIARNMAALDQAKLSLRNNPGGGLTASIEIPRYFRSAPAAR